MDACKLEVLNRLVFRFVSPLALVCNLRDFRLLLVARRLHWQVIFYLLTSWFHYELGFVLLVRFACVLLLMLRVLHIRYFLLKANRYIIRDTKLDQIIVLVSLIVIHNSLHVIFFRAALLLCLFVLIALFPCFLEFANSKFIFC